MAATLKSVTELSGGSSRPTVKAPMRDMALTLYRDLTAAGCDWRDIVQLSSQLISLINADMADQQKPDR